MVVVPRKHLPWMESNRNSKRFSHIICGDIETLESRKMMINALTHIV